MTLSAPAAMALATSPPARMPPSAMTGTPSGAHASAHSITALSWGTPTPATTRVVQTEPGPTPTLTPSAPAATRSRAPSAVATLPATISARPPTASRTRPRASRASSEWPCAMSSTSTSAPASWRAWARSTTSPRTPIAAPTARRPRSSLVASGRSVRCSRSRSVMSPTRRSSSATSGSFSTRASRSRRAACSAVVPGAPTTRRPRGVMSSATGVSGSVWSITSRRVSMPASRSSPSTTTSPLTPWSSIRSSASASRAPAPIVWGSGITRASARLTRATSATCCSTERKRCTMPMPPSRAMAIAISDSVTVSMLAETIGAAMRSRRVSRVETLTSDRELIPLRRGASRTSS